MPVPRNLLQKIKPFLNRKEFIAIVGPRQSGKTTFLEIVADYLQKGLKVKNESIQTITFEDRILLNQFETDPVAFIKSYLPGKHSDTFFFLIDEFQYAFDGGQKLKLIFDTVKGLKIIITGSSSLDIKAHVGKYMVGRLVSFHLYPFTFSEYLYAHNPKLGNIYREHNERALSSLVTGKQLEGNVGKDLFHDEMRVYYENYAVWGGYPAVTLAETDDIRKKLLRDTYNNYILKDIKTLLELATEKNLFMLSQYLATQTGNIIVYQNTSQASNLNHRQLKKHLTILEETYVSKTVNPFFKNRKKELSKNPKIYFIDMGFRNNLIENMNPLPIRSDTGAIIENTVFIRLNELFGEIHKINFWRTKAGAEVDFVLHYNEKIIPLEVKYSAFSTEKVSKSFINFLNTFKPEHAVVLTKNYWGCVNINNTRVYFIPVCYI